MKTTARVCIVAALAWPSFIYGADRPAALDSDVEQLIKQLNVPGVAIAIVKDGEVVAAKGYGVRRLGSAETVDADTLFSICSNSKAFTAVTLAQLVDEKKISWDDPVIKYLPAFQMHDPYVTREITIRDLLVHRSGLGLGAGDLLWTPPTTFTTEETVARLRFVQPASSFRSKFAYDNLLYVVAGQVVAAVEGKPWSEVLQEKVLRPAGLSSTTTSFDRLAHGANSAAPHALDEGAKLRPTMLWSSENVTAACGVNSTARDLARWMNVLLAGGKLSAAPDAPRLFSERQARELFNPVTPIAVGEPAKGFAATKPSFMSYALGFRVTDYRGEPMAYHTGTMLGYASRVTLFPRLKLGIAVLTNASHSNGARTAIMLRIADAYLGVPATDWIAAVRDLEEEQAAKDRATRAKEAAARMPDSKPSMALDRYAGKYSDPWFGEVTVTKEGEGLVMRMPRSPLMVGDLVHWQSDTFVARWRERMLDADAYVSFDLEPDGRIFAVRMKAVSALTDFSFDFHDLHLRPIRETNP